MYTHLIRRKLGSCTPAFQMLRVRKGVKNAQKHVALVQFVSYAEACFVIGGCVGVRVLLLVIGRMRCKIGSMCSTAGNRGCYK